ncbi:Cytochrome P450 CYP305 [Frankliniella occidentalis]|uniref:Methyl farnesoate epoxidase n=1 Tax=Frankliniella occidentalis TaxID=133901 RepID=A0A6J1S6K3_FRAOC|nr:methyl farnesoate epoxidase [Frankliniella occidentalis]KAE8738123.1 Cytochrome P450 CYP305 [Frankliniella occidentalis]
MLALALLALLLLALFALFNYLGNLRRLKNFPPGPLRLPLVGSMPFFPAEHWHLYADKHWLSKYGPLVGLTTGRDTMLIVCGAQEVLDVLAHEDCQGRADLFFTTERSFGKKLGIMFSDGPYWTEQRRFALRELRDLGMGKSVMEGVVLDEVDATLEAVARDGPAVQPNMLFHAPVLNVLWWLVSGKPFSKGVGKEQDAQSVRLHHIMEKFIRTKNVAVAPVDSWPFLKYVAPELSSYNAIYGPIFDMQAFIREEIKLQQQDRTGSFMSKYMDRIETAEPGSTLTEESLIISVLDMFIAGGESTANTLSFCLLYMALHPDKQAKLHAELDAVVGGADKTVGLADRTRLPYTEATLTEVMRINPIAPLSVPHSNTKDVELNGYTIPKGTMINLSLWVVLNDKAHWGDPEVFRPERFIGKDGAFVKDPWMANFGHGKRVCIGEAFTVQTAFLFFANVMNRLRISAPPGGEPLSTKPQPGLTCAPQNYTVLAEPRRSSSAHQM